MRFARSSIISLAAEIPPNVVTSDDIEARLATVYRRLRLPAGRLELMSGIHENKRGEMKEERNDNDEEHDGDGIDSIL